MFPLFDTLYSMCECVQVAMFSSIVLTPAPRDGNDEKNDIPRESKCVALMQHCINNKDLVPHHCDKLLVFLSSINFS